MSRFNQIHFKTRFTIYYILKSTAWITPIFFLFLQQQVHLDISQVLKISGTLMILPFVFDIPLGILADRVGARKLLLIGTLLQFFSLLGFFILPSQVAYIAYLTSIIIAENCYSGAEQSYLSQNLSSAEEVKDFLKQLNQYFYYITIPAIVMGVVLFQINPYFPLYAQLLSFSLAFAFVVGLQGGTQRVDQEFSTELNLHNLKMDLRSVFRSSETLGLILFGGVFAGFVQISGKTIQGKIDLFSAGNTSLWLVLSYVSANVASGSSLLIWRKVEFLKKLKISHQIICCLVLFLVSQGLMLNAHIVFIFIGYVLLSGVKSVYRPLVSGELVNQFRQFPRMATKLSIVSTSTMIIVASFHIISGYLMAASDYGLLILIALMSVVFGIGFYLFNRERVFPSYSGKLNVLTKFGGKKVFIQTYPNDVALPDYETVNRVAQSWFVRIPRLVAASGNSLTFDFVEHQLLSELKPSMQMELSGNLLSQQMIGLLKQEAIGGAEFEINGDHFLEHLKVQRFLVKPLLDDKYVGLVHGDLNPNNVIFSEAEMFVVDWDLLGLGYAWYDGLSLLTHPDLKLSLEEQKRLLMQIYSFEDENWLQLLIKEFCRYKYLQLVQIDKNPMQILARRYLHQSRDIGVLV